MKSKLFLIIAWIVILVCNVQAKYLNAHVIVNDGVFVYTNSEWNSEILGMNHLKNENEVKQNIINNESAIKYDMAYATSEQKLTMMYTDMIQKAQTEKVDLNSLIPSFIEETDKFILGDANLETQRNELLSKNTYSYDNKVYLMQKQKSFIYVDNIYGTTSLLENGTYCINNIDAANPQVFYLFNIVNSKAVIDCHDIQSGISYDRSGYGLDKSTKAVLKYNEINDTLMNAYNIIDNSKEYIESQIQNSDNSAKLGNEYSSGGDWDLENNLTKSMKFIEGSKPSDSLQPASTGNVKYDINTITVVPSTKEGRGLNSIYYNERNTLTNSKNLKYIYINEDPYNLSGGIYEVEKEQVGDYEFNNKAEHIVFERPYDKAATEVNVKTANGSYLLINFKLNKKDYINSQIQVFKDGVFYQDITIDSPKKDVLLDVSDCSTIKFTVKPISKQIDLDANSNKENIVFEPGKVVQKGVYSKNFVENNQDASNYYEYNDMRLYADMYLIF